jgi:dihydrofolate reductase
MFAFGQDNCMPKMKALKLIVAVERNWGIGREGSLLFRIREDMKRIKAMTTGQVIIAGRKTLLNFPHGQPLPERINIILTHQTDFEAAPAIIAHNPSELANELSHLQDKEIFVLGGSSIYDLLLPYCDLAYVTQVDLALPADRHFPDLDNQPGWQLLDKGEWMQLSGFLDKESERRYLTCRFCLYRQGNPQALEP